MKLIYEESVDWEPLHIRFRLKKTPTQERCDIVATFVMNWMHQRESEDPQKWQFCEYSTKVLASGTVEAFCELMPSDEVQPLADAVAHNFNFVGEMRLGEPEMGSQSLKKIDWFDVPGDKVTIDGVEHTVDDFTISFTAVSVGQFCEFIEATGWLPVPDKINEDPGYTIENFKLNFGQSPKIPLFGVTHDDAVAFCDWSGYRLPTDAELRSFYEVVAAQSQRKFNWDGENWTSTPAGIDHYYIRQGPFPERPAGEVDPFRKPLHRHHYEHLEAPSFRIVKR